VLAGGGRRQAANLRPSQRRYRRLAIKYGQLVGLWLLVQNGTILGTIYARIMLFLGGLLLLGAAFKILHWIGANVLLVVALAGIALTYSLRFFASGKKAGLAC
jgi:hypothetical protein